MRFRLLLLLIVLLAGVLLALGVPLAASQAATEQQRVVVDRIDDTARFASLAQFAAVDAQDAPEAPGTPGGDPLSTLVDELHRYHELYGIRAGVFHRDRSPMAVAPAGWEAPSADHTGDAFAEALAGRRSRGLEQIWPWDDKRLVVASPVIRDGDVIAVVVTDSPTGPMRSRILHGWMPIIVGEAAAMLLAVAAAFGLTRWVLRPIEVLDKATHDIATGRLTSRVAESGGPQELRRLARSFNEMADNVEEVLEQQRAFVADASHQLRNPLAALLLRIDLLGLALPPGSEEYASVQAEGKRLARVLDDLLDLALAEHSPADLRLTDVAGLVGERMAAWGPVAERRGVTLEQTGPAAATGWADPVALSSALDAVIDNALKFSPAGEQVTVAARPDGDWIVVEIADTGPGLPEDEMERIGDRFWRSGRHQNVAGSGLGLSIVHALLSAGGARIAYARNQPHGLRVTVTVPRHPPGGRDAPARASPVRA
ncbi:HAMP domain-containing sensor histidine kinase [Streptomyces sp. ACA25]|uniref:sensor histidine kinase n=1 Tax=Streptomyces sp. ACA25 TaxID=3022596 RepID=UPI0023080C49|nr:HAMP domain-containing sensor histidine kinase [Streptomyces sp. ACA25]MDB1088847.1 HAMP domain-containing sensor histidine kinase [Streptomyces sp. ACA25]